MCKIGSANATLSREQDPTHYDRKYFNSDEAEILIKAVRRINDVPYDLLCETALILDAKYVHKNGVNNNDKAVQPAKYKKGDEQKVYAVPCQPEIQTQVQFHEVHQSYYKERQAYTPDMLDENGRKIHKTGSYPQQVNHILIALVYARNLIT